MSLTVAGNIANAALRSSEVSMSVASSNVANASTDGYTRKTANQTTSDTAVGYASVDISSISSTVNQYLLKSVISAQSDVGKATVLDTYLDQYQTSLGTTDSSSDSSISDLINDVSDSFSTLATSPESDSARAAAVENLSALAETLRSTSSTVQSLRKQADQEISTTVDNINTTLDTIDDLNDQIVKGKALGQNTGDLEDQRAEALKTLSGDIGINYQIDSNGAVRISTTSGTSLLDSSVHKLSYSAAGTVSDSTSFDPITVGGKDITSSITSGTLGGLLELRDTDLPAQQDELDELANQLKDTLNEISNAGTTYPPPQSLTGTTTVSGSDAFSASGTLRVAVTDSSGDAVSVQDFDLSSYSTVQGMVDAINTMSGVTASINSDGKLVLQADDSDNGVALGGTDDAVGSDGKGFSAYFGMNDLMTGTGASDLRVSETMLDDSGLLPTGALSMESGVSAGDTVVTSGEGTIAADFKAAFTSTQSFDAAGNLPGRTGTFSAYAGAIIQDAATAASKASTNADNQKSYADSLQSTLSSQSGVNVDEETAAISNLESAYQAAAAVMKAVQEMFATAVDMIQ